MTKRRMMLPGPTELPPEVCAAGALQMIHERTAEFGEMFRRVTERLGQVMMTANDVLIFTASSTGACEATLQNLFSPGDRILVANNGYFGHRWVQMGRAFGLDVVELVWEWGESVDAAAVAASVAADPSIRAAICVHLETSTGAVTDVRAFAEAAQEVLCIIDGTSSLGSCELRTDDWGIDVLVAASHKALMSPPGLSFVSVSDAAWAAHDQAGMHRFYFDWSAARETLSLERPRTPWTSAITLIRQLDAALGRMLEEGMENVLLRHVRLGRAARAGLKAMGMRLLVPEEERSAAVTTAWVPSEIDAELLVEVVAREYDVHVTGVPGLYKGKAVRIGHSGYCDLYDVLLTLAALEFVLASSGHSIDLGVSVSEAMRAFTASEGSSSAVSLLAPDGSHGGEDELGT